MISLIRWLVSIFSVILFAAPAWASAKPDFNDHAAVVASLKSLLDQCGSDATCLKACNDAVESMPKYANSHPRNRSLRRIRWKDCLKHQPAASVAPPKPAAAPSAPAVFDKNRIVISNLRLGDKLEQASDRITTMDVDGYYLKEKRERGTGTFRWNDRAERGDMPDIVKNYEARIVDKKQRVYVFLEAAGDGTLYKIDFKQKGAIDPEAARQAVIERFGAPTKTTSSWLYWGCENEQRDVCVKASASKFVFEIFAQDLAVKEAWRRVYEGKVSEARGAKKGLQF